MTWERPFHSRDSLRRPGRRRTRPGRSAEASRARGVVVAVGLERGDRLVRGDACEAVRLGRRRTPSSPARASRDARSCGRRRQLGRLLVVARPPRRVLRGTRRGRRRARGNPGPCAGSPPRRRRPARPRTRRRSATASTSAISSSSATQPRDAPRPRDAASSVVPRERLVRDSPDEVLEEAVLAVLGRARVGLEREHLLPHERREQRLQLALRRPASAATASRVNVLPSTAASWSSRRSSAESPSRRAAMSACSVSGTSSSPISPAGR